MNWYCVINFDQNIAVGIAYDKVILFIFENIYANKTTHSQKNKLLNLTE